MTALGEVLGYLLDEKNNARKVQQVCRRCFDALAPGGLLIFDLPEVGLDIDRAPFVDEGADWTCFVRFEHDAKRHRLTRHIVTFRGIC